MPGIGEHARAAPDSIALVSMGAQIPYSDLDRRQRALVGALRGAGVRPGDRIAVRARNRVELLEVTTGVLRAGIVPVPVNPLLAPPEVGYMLEDSGARWLFCEEVVETPPDVERTVTFGDAYERLLHEAEPVADLADLPLGRPMHYTSGTTGRPKGVWVAPVGEKHAASASGRFRSLWGLASDDVHLVCSPLTHSAPHRFALRTLDAGGTVVVQTRFDAEETLAAIDLFSIRTTFVVPTHVERIVALPRSTLRGRDLTTVRLLAHAGAPMRPETKRRLIELVPTGSVWEFYGATEGQATRISSAEWMRKPGSVGTPQPGARILVTDDGGRPLASGEVGEVWIDDPAAERFEYWGDPAATRRAWRGRAFSVGDLGHLDPDGYLYLSGRLHRTIVTGGVNVYPQEVEAVLGAHPSVAEVVVYGVPDEEWGEMVRAAIVPAFGQPLDVGVLRSWARERLAGYKVPRRIEVVDELPRTATGKLRPPGPYGTSPP